MPECDQLLQRARAALRRGHLDLAQSLILEAGDGVWKEPRCLNILGLIAQSRGQWSLAKRLWGRAARADKLYGPPRQNLRRYYELYQFGRSEIPFAFGDEPHFLLMEILR